MEHISCYTRAIVKKGGTCMIQVSNVGLRYGDRKLFEDVNIKFQNLRLLKPFYKKM